MIVQISSCSYRVSSCTCPRLSDVARSVWPVNPPLLPAVSGCSSRQLLVGFINRPTKQHTSVSHLESLNRLHKNTSRACEVKLLCVCVLDKKEKDMLNKKRGELASGMAGHRPAGGERLHWAPLVWCILLSLLLVFLPFLTY